MRRVFRSPTAQTVAMWLTLGLLVIVVLVVFRVAFDSRDNREFNQKQERIAEQQRKSQRRSDCARRWSSHQSAIVRERDALGWDGLIAAVEDNPLRLEQVKAELKSANERVQQLAPLSDVVNRHCPTVNGKDPAP